MVLSIIFLEDTHITFINILSVSTVFSTPYLFLDTAARLQWPVTHLSTFYQVFFLIILFNNIHTTFQISSKRDITLEFRNNLLLNWNGDLCMCNFQITPLSFVLSHCHTNIIRIQTYIMQYVFYLYIYIYLLTLFITCIY